MLKRVAGLIVLMASMQADAASAPVAVVLPPSYEASSDPQARDSGGLLVWMLEGHINKKAQKQIDQFQSELADPTFAERVSKSFACIGSQQVSADCPRALLLTGASGDAEQQLKASNAQRVLLIRLHPLKTDERIRMRAIVNDTVVGANGTQVTRYFTAVFESRAPDEDPKASAAYWAEGSPSRLSREVDKGIEELRQMLTLLDREVTPGGSPPASWETLANTDALKQAGRLKCGGGGCSKHRVVRDDGNRVWLTTLYAQGPTLYGWCIVSLDDATAKRYSNIMLPVQTTDQ